MDVLTELRDQELVLAHEQKILNDLRNKAVSELCPFKVGQKVRTDYSGYSRTGEIIRVAYSDYSPILRADRVKITVQLYRKDGSLGTQKIRMWAPLDGKFRTPLPPFELVLDDQLTKERK